MRISSAFTPLTKWGFPALWFGVLAFFAFEGLRQAQGLMMAVVLGLAVASFLLMRAFVWDLADSVEDHGSYLLARRGATEARIALGDVEKVNATMLISPPRITLFLREPGVFGKEVSFTPRTGRLVPYSRSPLADQLTLRAHQAREGGTAPAG